MGRVDRDIHEVSGRDPSVIRAALVQRGRKLAPDYAPDKQYREPSRGIEQVILDEAKGTYGPDYEIDPYGLVVQISEETAGMQSLFWVERANPGGIGAIDAAPGQAIDFTVDDRGQKLSRDAAERRGIRAHVAKLRNYRFGEGPWSTEDPRFAAVKAAGYLGIAQTWRGLQGRWASSQTYAASLEEIWAALDRIIGEEPAMLPLPTAQDLGFPVQLAWADASVKGPYAGVQDAWVKRRAALDLDWQVVHDTEGWWPTDRDYLKGGHDASARAVIAPDGTIALGARVEEIAWTGGSPQYNALGLHYEVSGFAATGYSDPQYRALAALMVFDNHQLKNAPPLLYVGKNGRGIIGHQDIPNPAPGQKCAGQWGGISCHGDPGGKFDWNKLAGYIHGRLQGAPVPAAAPEIPGGSKDPWNDYASGNPYAKQQGEPFWILNPFIEWINGHGGFWTVGFVVTGAFMEPGADGKLILVQYFEGGRLEWHPENPTDYQVLRGHLGIEVLKAQHPERLRGVA